MKSDSCTYHLNINKSYLTQLLIFTICLVGNIKTGFSFSRRSILVSPSLTTSRIGPLSAVDETLQQEEQQKQQERRTRAVVPTVNSASLQISVANPFGPSTANLKTSEIKDEILGLLHNQHSPRQQSNALKYMELPVHFRLEYLVKVLEQRYVPIQTIPFLNLVLAGSWSKLYTNSISRKADSNLEFDISVQIQPHDDAASSSAAGQVRDVTIWRYKEVSEPEHITTGSLEVRSRYELSSRGELQISLEQHLLLPDTAPRSIGFEELVQSIQRSIPFENFDPDGVTATTTFIDGDFRIVRLSGEKFYNVFNIFRKAT